MYSYFEALVLLIWTIFVMFGSAIFHEADLARNFNKYGDAKAWLYEIKIAPEKQ